MAINYNSIRKRELADLYDLSEAQLKRLMNQVYYEELSAAGYRKRDKTLSPKVLRAFFEEHGYPHELNNSQQSNP